MTVAGRPSRLRRRPGERADRRRCAATSPAARYDDGRAAGRGRTGRRRRCWQRCSPTPTTPGRARRRTGKEHFHAALCRLRSRVGAADVARDADRALTARTVARRGPPAHGVTEADRLRRRRPEPDPDARACGSGARPITLHTSDALGLPAAGQGGVRVRRPRLPHPPRPPGNARRPRPAPATPASSAPSLREPVPDRPRGYCVSDDEDDQLSRRSHARCSHPPRRGRHVQARPATGLTWTKHGIDAGAYARLDELAKTFPRRERQVRDRAPEADDAVRGGLAVARRGRPGRRVGVQVVRPRQHRQLDPAGDHRSAAAPATASSAATASCWSSWYQDTAASPARVSFVKADSLDNTTYNTPRS